MDALLGDSSDEPPKQTFLGALLGLRLLLHGTAHHNGEMVAGCRKDCCAGFSFALADLIEALADFVELSLESAACLFILIHHIHPARNRLNLADLLFGIDCLNLRFIQKV